MIPNEYQKLALRTEKTPEFLRLRFDDERTHSRLLHALIGLCTEAGEAQDAVKKFLIYDLPFDEINMVEEFGDVLWYIALGLDALGVTMEDAMRRNIEKLRVRYPDKFTEERALSRDPEAERKTLEKGRP